MRAGYLDLVMQSHVQGWAAADGKPARPWVSVNGERVGRAIPNVTRPDLAEHGFPPEAGFSFNLPEPLGPDDVLSAAFDDGTELGHSPSTAHQQRLRAIFQGIDFSNMSGLELGPLDRPILSKRRARVFYVDRASREDLIAEFSTETHRATCEASLIRDVDIVWRDGASLAECAPRQDYDFCLASHVVEHAPDMIGWLTQIAAVLREGGVLNLAVPDKIRTFDRHRSPTTPGQFIGWHLRGIKIPAPEQIFDCVSLGADEPNFKDALAMARVAAAGGYVGTHCAVYTDRSFLDAMAALASIGLIPYRCEAFFPGIPPNEFIASLRKDSGDDHAKLAQSYSAALVTVSG